MVSLLWGLIDPSAPQSMWKSKDVSYDTDDTLFSIYFDAFWETSDTLSKDSISYLQLSVMLYMIKNL